VATSQSRTFWGFCWRKGNFATIAGRCVFSQIAVYPALSVRGSQRRLLRRWFSVSGVSREESISAPHAARAPGWINVRVARISDGGGKQARRSYPATGQSKVGVWWSSRAEFPSAGHRAATVTSRSPHRSHAKKGDGRMSTFHESEYTPLGIKQPFWAPRVAGRCL
jgi:hypothetical protein